MAALMYGEKPRSLVFIIRFDRWRVKKNHQKKQADLPR
jgi:hypothetical protein